MSTAEVYRSGNEQEIMPQGFSIAIDGPVASGKGTLANVLAKRLGGFYLDTGAMYRSVAFQCLQNGIDINDQAAVETTLPSLDVVFEGGRISLNGSDVTERIREQDVTHGSSVVAQYGSVREDLVRKQQQIAKEAMKNGQMVVIEGRDVGTRILPNASLKIFLTARPEVRALRRAVQDREKGIKTDAHEALKDLRKRDERDMNRAIDPLPSNPSELGYFILDNSDQFEEETVESIMAELKRRGLVHD